MFRRIVVPVALDQVERAEKTLPMAARLLEPGGRLLIVNVVELFQSYISLDLPADIIDQESAAAKDRLTALRDRLKIDADIDVRYGSASNEIIKAAAEFEADLVLIASHRPGLANYFIGATADRVVRHCPVSVLVDR